MLICQHKSLRIDIHACRFAAVGGESARLLRRAEGSESAGFGGSSEGCNPGRIGGINPHSAAERSAAGILGGAVGVHRTVAAKAFAEFIVVFFETEKSADDTSTAAAFVVITFAGTAGVGRTADPGGSVVLDSPVASEEMTATCFLMGATDEGNCQEDNDGNDIYKFGGE
jgi:hypothetical protein